MNTVLMFVIMGSFCHFKALGGGFGNLKFHLLYKYIYIPNSIKVALGIGQLRIGKVLFAGHSSKALHCFPYAQMPNAQLPKQPLLN